MTKDFMIVWIVFLIFVGFLIYIDDDNNDDDKNDNSYKKRHIDYENPNKGKINVRGIWY